jgi:hypothetical protein
MGATLQQIRGVGPQKRVQFIKAIFRSIGRDPPVKLAEKAIPGMTWVRVINAQTDSFSGGLASIPGRVAVPSGSSRRLEPVQPSSEMIIHRKMIVFFTNRFPGTHQQRYSNPCEYTRA